MALRSPLSIDSARTSAFGPGNASLKRGSDLPIEQECLWKSYEAPQPQAGASRERNIVLIVPLNPAY